MNDVLLRSIAAPLFGLALCFIVTPRPRAVVKEMPIAHFAGRAVDIADHADDGPIDIMIERWSTDKERDDLVQRFVTHGPSELLTALDDVRVRAGVILMPGVQATGARARGRRSRNLMFARQIDTPAGRQLIVASGTHVGLGEYARWGASADNEFTLIDIRFGPDGKGVGKAASPNNVRYNKATGTIEIADYAKEPARLIDVKIPSHARTSRS
jgi:hypothetical protein